MDFWQILDLFTAFFDELEIKIDDHIVEPVETVQCAKINLNQKKSIMHHVITNVLKKFKILQKKLFYFLVPPQKEREKERKRIFKTEKCVTNAFSLSLFLSHLDFFLFN